MYRHYLHGVIVRFRHGRVADARPFVLHRFRPPQELTQGEGSGAGAVCPVVFLGAGLLNEELPAAPNFPGPVFGPIQLVQPAVADEIRNQLRHAVGATPVVILPQYPHPVPYRRHRPQRGAPPCVRVISIILRIPQPAGLVVPQRLAARVPPAQQVGIGAGQRRRAQGGHYRHFVRRVVNGAQTVEQILHLLGVKVQGTAGQSIGDVADFVGVRTALAFQSPQQYAQPRAGTDEDADIAEPGRSLFPRIFVVHLETMGGVFPGVGRYQIGDIFGLLRAISRGIILHSPAEHLRRA